MHYILSVGIQGLFVPVPIFVVKFTLEQAWKAQRRVLL